MQKEMNESQSSQKGGAANKKAKVDLTLGGVVKLAMSFVMDVMDNAKLDFFDARARDGREQNPAVC